VLRPAGITYEIRETSGPGDATTLAAEAVGAGYDAIAVCGGDGTIAEVVAGVAGHAVPLAVMPCGTGNGISGQLGLPGTLPAAARLLTDGGAHVRALDAGRINDRLFLLRAATGAIARIDRQATGALKHTIGGLAYALSTGETLFGLRPSAYRIEADGEVLEAMGVACIVANGGGMGRVKVKLAEDISMEDGLLDVLVMTGAGLRHPGRALTQTGISAPAAPRLRAKRIRIDVEPPELAVADGEPAGGTPALVEVLPGALRVIVPGPAADR
jgi:diacylglycerol kinase (ATP)